jgi:hypothetical protein
MVASSPTAQPSPAESAPAEATGNRPPVVEARLIPAEERKNNRRFYVAVTASDPDGNLSEVVAILQTPSSGPFKDIDLDIKHRIEIEVDGDRLEIRAPEPQAILNHMQAYGGIQVQNGQLIDFKQRDDHRYKAEFKDDILQIEAQALLLQVTAVDSKGISHQVTASLPVVPDDDNDDNNGKDGESDDED